MTGPIPVATDPGHTDSPQAQELLVVLAIRSRSALRPALWPWAGDAAVHYCSSPRIRVRSGDSARRLQRQVRDYRPKCASWPAGSQLTDEHGDAH